jgi:hypothetical protein
MATNNSHVIKSTKQNSLHIKNGILKKNIHFFGFLVNLWWNQKGKKTFNNSRKIRHFILYKYIYIYSFYVFRIFIIYLTFTSCLIIRLLRLRVPCNWSLRVLFINGILYLCSNPFPRQFSLIFFLQTLSAKENWIYALKSVAFSCIYLLNTNCTIYLISLWIIWTISVVLLAAFTISNFFSLSP